MLPISPNTSLKRSISTPNTLSALRSSSSNQDDAFDCPRNPQSIQRYSSTYASTNRLFNETSPEELANQLTLIDWEIFSRITRKELKPGQWTGPMKHMCSPNVVAFTRRFNMLIYWISDEILSQTTARKRAEIIGYFIRVCTFLIDIKSLYSAFAIFCTLTSEPIHRLEKTWSSLSKKERIAFDKIFVLFNQSENNSKLRSFMDNAISKTPNNPVCIPSLSIFLRDIIHIDSYYPANDPLRATERKEKLELIYSFIEKCQQSNFDHIHLVEEVYDYLNSFNYIEELQKFREDNYYKNSIKLEPPEEKGGGGGGEHNSNKSKLYYGRFNSNYDICSTSNSSSPMKAGQQRQFQPFLDDLKRNSLFNQSLNESLFEQTKDKKQPFKPGHRKTNSLEMGVLGMNLNSSTGRISATLPQQQSKQYNNLHVNLIDDSPAFDVFESHIHVNDHYSRKPHLEVVANQSRDEDDTSSLDEDSSNKNCYTERDFLYSGVVGRKNILKIGKKPSLQFWTNFYMCLTDDSLVFFNVKHAGQSHTKSLKPLKRFYLLDWTVAYIDDQPQMSSSAAASAAAAAATGAIPNEKCNIFTLADRSCSTVYKVRTSNEKCTKEWIQAIRKVTSNLKSFYI